MQTPDELTIGLLIASWFIWAANAAVIVAIKRRREQVLSWTALTFTVSSFAVTLVTVVDLGLMKE